MRGKKARRRMRVRGALLVQNEDPTPQDGWEKTPQRDQPAMAGNLGACFCTYKTKQKMLAIVTQP